MIYSKFDLMFSYVVSVIGSLHCFICEKNNTKQYIPFVFKFHCKK